MCKLVGTAWAAAVPRPACGSCARAAKCGRPSRTRALHPACPQLTTKGLIAIACGSPPPSLRAVSGDGRGCPEAQISQATTRCSLACCRPDRIAVSGKRPAMRVSRAAARSGGDGGGGGARAPAQHIALLCAFALLLRLLVGLSSYSGARRACSQCSSHSRPGVGGSARAGRGAGRRSARRQRGAARSSRTQALLTPPPPAHAANAGPRRRDAAQVRRL